MGKIGIGTHRGSMQEDSPWQQVQNIVFRAVRKRLRELSPLSLPTLSAIIRL